MYLSLHDDIIPNHGYVVISDIGSTDDTALICHTNHPATINNNAHSGGNWLAPDNLRVTGTTVPGFKRTRAPMIVRLLRYTATDPPSEGIYECLVMDDTDTLHSFFVGLYYSGEGISCTYTVIIIIPLAIWPCIIYILYYCNYRRHYNSWWYCIHCGLLPQWSQSSVHPYLYLHWWTCYLCHLDQRH